MLFNSYIFLFGFLPVTLALTYALGRHQWMAKVVLTVLSLAFYAYWRPVHLPLLLFSIVFNYLMGGYIQRARAAGRDKAVKWALIAGITVDVGMLGWFKYANFVGATVSDALGVADPLPHIILPLAISFFTFQKIAYLIDSSRGEAKSMNFLDFSLFAAFFPQLIAGPIVHYKEVVPQLQGRLFARRLGKNLLIGLTIFAMGLFKKTVIADTLAEQAKPLFELASQGHALNLGASWLAAILFTFQLYFDFSGYSDMAIGLGRMFGVKLPLNFHSPLRAASITEYWRRWHMTLQRFIVSYMFQPLSIPLNRAAAEKGLEGWPAFFVAVATPTFVTFVAVGVWHGAGWTFAAFGVMHGLYICINEAWREQRKRTRRKLRKQGKTMGEPKAPERIAYHLITLVAVAYANVMFRAADVGAAASVWSGMSGLNGLNLDLPADFGWDTAIALLLGIGLVFLAPNTQQIMGRYDPAYNWREWRNTAPAPIRWTWRPSPLGLAFAGVTLTIAILAIQRGQAVFLYFNF